MVVPDGERGVEGIEDAHDQADLEPVRAALLGRDDPLPRHAGALGDLGLAQVAPLAQPTDREARLGQRPGGDHLRGVVAAVNSAARE